MGNMSYCRFQNTLGDLQDCKNTLEAMREGEERPLGPEEFRAARSMIKKMVEMLTVVADANGLDITDLVDVVDMGTREKLEALLAPFQKAAETGPEDEDEE